MFKYSPMRLAAPDMEEAGMVSVPFHHGFMTVAELILAVRPA
jgi:hypothetical protein